LPFSGLHGIIFLKKVFFITMAHEPGVRALFKRIVISIARPFHQSDQGNPYLLITMDYFTK
jgi:hypothetical protein